MIYKSFSELRAHALRHARSSRVACAGGEDSHTLEAVSRAMADGIIHPLLVGDIPKIRVAMEVAGMSEIDVDLVQAGAPAEVAACAVALVRDGKADFLMKGKLETGDVLRAVVNRETGLGRGRTMSHIAINEVPSYHKLLVTTDGGMLLAPTLEQKRDVILNAVEALRALGYEEPKVGVLAAAERVNPKAQDSLDAAELKRQWQKGQIGGCIVEGPISFDLATVRERAVTKGYESPCAGDCDILVVPNITAGNILGKSLVEMAGAKMAGLIVGARCPIVVTSRGSSAEEKYNALVLAASMTSHGGEGA